MKTGKARYKDFADRPVNEIRFNRHPKRKNNEIVAAMYQMYRTGKSLAEIARVYHKTRQAVESLFKTRGYALREKQLKGLTIIDGIPFTLHSGGYLRGTVAGRRVFASLYVWEKYHGKIPVGHKLFYIDGNKLNNKIENLKLIPFSAMPKQFNPTGYRGRKKSLIERTRAERDARWAKAMAI